MEQYQIGMVHHFHFCVQQILSFSSKIFGNVLIGFHDTLSMQQNEKPKEFFFFFVFFF